MHKWMYFVNNITKQCKKLLLLWCLFLLSFSLSCAASGTAIRNHNNIVCLEHERTALLKFKQSIEVDRCGLLSSWDDREENRNCCRWYGVRCSNTTSRVIMLNLGGVETDFSDEICLEGKVGSSLVDLKHLRYLDLSFNNFSGPIPSFIGSLVNLRHLNLSHTGFIGEVPHQLGNLSSLTSLDLSYGFQNVYANDLQWLSHLSLLRIINLNSVYLSNVTNWLQIMNNLPYLRVLQLDGCFPPFVPRTLSYKNSTATLSVLVLSQNHDSIDSSIFQWLFNLSGINTHLTHLDLSDNDLRSPLPSAFGNLQALSHLDLSFNKLQDNCLGSLENIQLPKTLGNLCSLQELHLSNNNLNNELSNIIHTLPQCVKKSLLYLDLSINLIWGAIPDSISTFSSLIDLYLYTNRLNGTVSQSLGQLSKLETLDLSSNALKGILSDIHFSNLSRLRELYLQNNSALTLNISVDWVSPFQLDSIELSNCRLGPMFPKWLLRQKEYSRLDIANTGISDSIPKTFWNLLPSKVVYLNMSGNNIHGTIPNLDDLQLTPNFQNDVDIEIDISFNNIEGVIPSFPKYVTSLFLNNNRFSNHLPFLCPKLNQHLSALDLSNNLLTGELPDCWMKFDQLSILHLENNNFSGVIPSSIAYMHNLQVLHLRNNTIWGGIQGSLENLTSLLILDLSFNSLSGNISPSIGTNFRRLEILILGSNNFDGEIPSSLCQMSSLQILDLSTNHITGTIPKCMHNLTAMKSQRGFMFAILYQQLHPNMYSFYDDAATIKWKRQEQSFKNTLGLVKAIDISNNKLEGEIPVEISFLRNVISLDLSRNNLVGGITPKIEQMKALEFLDLSNNHLSGKIPTSLANLNFLEMLDLSYNNLSGKIPTGVQLQSMDASSYIGNFELCGLPLPKCTWETQSDDKPTNKDDVNHHDETGSGDIFTVGFYVSVVLGFIVGFWGVCGTLVLKRSWRHAFFRFVDDMRDNFISWFS